MQTEFETLLRQWGVAADASILLAVSGGMDSMVMASLFAASPFQNLHILHANFSLRHTESDGDEDLVRSWAQIHTYPFHTVKFDTLHYAAQHGLSVEMAARDLRYTWFEKIRQDLQADFVALAHNANDSVETILLNLIRGTGLKGICGIAAKRDAFIRPLLRFDRTQIEVYANDYPVTYREDSTNTLLDFSRNRIRHKVLPEFKKINPEVMARMGKNARYLMQAQEILEEQLAQKEQDYCQWKDAGFFINIAKIQSDAHGAYWLFGILHSFGFGEAQMPFILRLMDGQTGQKVFSQSHALYRDRERLAVMPLTDLPEGPQEIWLDQNTQQIDKPVALEMNFIDIDSFTLVKAAHIAALDAEKLRFPLLLRPWRVGDFFCPFGMAGAKKKLSDFFTDIKLPLWEKQHQWVLCSGNDIVWVLGHRIDERYKIGSKTTLVAELRLNCSTDATNLPEPRPNR